MPNELTLWVDFNQYATSSSDWFFLVRDGDALVQCEECPCPPPPYCWRCTDSQVPLDRESTNYKEIWGVACGEDCLYTEPHLLGVYDQRPSDPSDEWMGCVWSKWDQYPYPYGRHCKLWYGVTRRCGLQLIAVEQICVEDPCYEKITSYVIQCEHNSWYHMMSKGFLYQPGQYVTPYQVIFHWISWDYNENTGVYTGQLRYLDCDCEEHIAAEGTFLTEPNTPTMFGYKFLASAGACDTGCSATLNTLLVQANAEGWVLYGEGIFARKSRAAATCYDYSYMGDKAQLCADTGTSFVYIDCNCVRHENVYSGQSYPITTYLEYPVCRCFDIRELILTYPEMFGVVDVSFGDNTVYTTDVVSYGSHTYNTDYFLPKSTSYDSYYCDFRNMYVIFDNTCVMSQSGYDNTDSMFITRFGVSGSPVIEVTCSNGTIMFEGHVEPFTDSNQSAALWPHSWSMNWNGLTIRWTAYSYYASSEGYEGSYWNKQAAQNLLDEKNSSSNKYSDDVYAVVSDYYYFYWPRTTTPSPNLSPPAHEGHIDWDPNEEEWKLYLPYHDWGDGVVYNVNFAMTNKGFVVNGQSGYSDTLSVAGMTAVASIVGGSPAGIVSRFYNIATKCEVEGSFGQTEVCPAGSVKEVSRQSMISSVPMYDMSFYITDVDESMGGCMGDDWWDEQNQPDYEEPSN